ncbi:uncharacterized protein LOC132699400 [Cylas formicarius]|uniref:uncharacterized protein LOC132699400 n=1 Tax=Cylas formicarius TaxID=197179 RepID=UPI002958594A|nr:uncharacterized protein LOC132699400 [Cylas formicarius]XP_060522056.1 uncharacterized protein LOC132699400 [Cylas formicarius]
MANSIIRCKFYSILILILCAIQLSTGNKCVQQGPCICKFDDYTEINLKDLIPPKSDSPFLTDTIGNNTYFFSGCKDQEFDGKIYNIQIANNLLGSLIKCVTIVTKTENKTDISYNCSAIGTDLHILFEESDKSSYYQLVYNQTRTNNLPSVQLVCVHYTPSYLKATSTGDALILFSEQACLKSVGSSGLSIGSIFLILLFVFGAIYLVGGCLIMHFVRGARGIEIIPNIDFWRSIPGLVKDGTVFVLSGFRPTVISTAETYDRI